MKTVEIKKINQSDWKRYKDIRLEALQKEPSAFGSSFESEVERSDEDWKNRFKDANESNSNKFFYAAQLNDNFAAIGGAFEDDDKAWNIIAIYTKQEYRGKGIGKKLFLSILEELKMRNISKIYLRVNVNQEAAVSLYKKMGFIIINTHKNQLLGDGKYYDEYEMKYEF